MIVVTGGAGFIGSALIWALNKQEITDIMIVDDVDHDQKERNIAPLTYERLMGISEFRQHLQEGQLNTLGITAILHMGACSDTSETDWEYLADNNVAYTQDVIRWCVDRGVRCIYASSAATYGDGSQGYSDNHDLFNELKPLNLYGKSKLDVDIWARDAGYLNEVVGLRYFNVFGPNEQHKGDMRSVIAKQFEQARDTRELKLFKSYRKEYADGEQKRDFIYVKDAVAATLFFLNNNATGVFNVGSGKARSWNEVGQALKAALGGELKITYIDMPTDLQAQYQYFTEADIDKLRQVGYKAAGMELTDAVKDYVINYLIPALHLGEDHS